MKFTFAVTIFFAFVNLAQAATAEELVAQAKQEREQKQKQLEAEQKRIDAEQIQKMKEIEQKRVQSQKDAQQKAAQDQKQKAMMATLMGQGLQATSTMLMMAAQMSKDPAMQQKLQGMAMLTMLGGMGAQVTGGMMNMNADKAASNSNNLDSMNAPTIPDSGLSTNDLANPTGSSQIASNPLGGEVQNSKPPGLVAVNPDDLRKGEIGKVFDEFEKQTGIPREDFSRGLTEGKTPADFLDGKMGMSKSGINAQLAAAKASSGLGEGLGPDVLGMASNFGMGDLAKQMANTESADYAGGGSSLGGSGSGGSSLPPLDLAGLMPPMGNEANARAPASDSNFNFERDVSPAIQQKLVAQGIVQTSLFDMITTRYRYLTPTLLGYGPSERKE